MEALKGSTLIACKLETGRTHQIRVHLSEAGHPIVGERVYVRGFQGEQIPAPRLMLHAAELGFVHPATNQDVRFEREPPADFAGDAGASQGTGGAPIVIPTPSAQCTRNHFTFGVTSRWKWFRCGQL